MKLTKLELSGFKSFADTVTLTFDEGVTAIVGPNGCGKSNVSDAVRWVLGEQSARLLRGGKMEDVIFQGAATRRPVNVAEVSLFFDNSAGVLPTPYTEVVVTRRLSRSGNSEYLLNNQAVRLRDVQDLLRGTGLGSDAGVVIEAKMIDLLLSDRADERRSLFEEAAGVGLYRDRRHTTSRRLEETSADLQRLEDLIAEVQSQVRSLARQKGKAERHTALTEEKFAVTITLARRKLDQLALDAAAFEQRHAELTNSLPQARSRLADAETIREGTAQARHAAERHRGVVVEDLNVTRVAVGKLDGDLAVASERLANAAQRRERAALERSDLEVRLSQARIDLEAGNRRTHRGRVGTSGHPGRAHRPSARTSRTSASAWRPSATWCAAWSRNCSSMRSSFAHSRENARRSRESLPPFMNASRRNLRTVRPSTPIALPRAKSAPRRRRSPSVTARRRVTAPMLQNRRGCVRVSCATARSGSWQNGAASRTMSPASPRAVPLSRRSNAIGLASPPQPPHSSPNGNVSAVA